LNSTLIARRLIRALDVFEISEMVELAEQIRMRIRESSDVVAASTNALPLWSDMSGCIALKPDGSFVHYEWDTHKITEEKSPSWQLLALVAGSKEHPELEALLPQKTEDARQCSMCQGTGCLVVEDYVAKNIVCGDCFGLGWVTDEILALSKQLDDK
jgi:hypothetical protein